MTPEPALALHAVHGIGEVRAGDDLASLLGDALVPLEPREGDVLVVTSKVVSKAEGRVRPAAEREQAITEESVRVVASMPAGRGITRIVEHRSGLVLAAAGVDASNTEDGTVLLLPLDADASARAIATALRERFSAAIGVVISDTLGRAWRVGQTDTAIGAAGVQVLEELAGTRDANGKELAVTSPAIADELAAAADLVAGKASGIPAVLVRGAGRHVTGLDAPGAARLVRRSGDLFHLGAAEAYELGRTAGRIEAKAELAAAATTSQGARA